MKGHPRALRGRVQPVWVIAGCCVGLAGLSLLLPWGLSFDPWGWVLYGREVVDPMKFDTASYPSWKPLPIGFTMIFALAGHVAPQLWLLFARAAALAALVLAYRVAWRLGGVVAGLFAAAGLLLTTDWLRYFASGASEPLLVALLLGAVELYLLGRHGPALFVTFAAALLRPEAWPFLALYAFLYARAGDRREKLVAGALIVAVPVLWFVPEWIGAGDPFYGSTIAKSSREAEAVQAQASPVFSALWEELKLVIAPLAIASLVAVALAARERRRLALALAGGAVAWLAIVGVMTALGYAGLPRYALPAAAVICILGGAGAAELIRLAGPRLAVLVAVAAVLVCVPFVIDRVDQMASTARQATARDRVQDQLFAAVDRVGGSEPVLSCGHPAVESPFFTSFAWRLGVPVRAINHEHQPRIVFRTRDLFIPGFGGQERVRRLVPTRPARMVTRVGEWEVLVSARAPRCASLAAAK